MTSGKDNLPTKKASADDVSAFLQKVAAVPRNATAGERRRAVFSPEPPARRPPTRGPAGHNPARGFGRTPRVGGP